MKLKPCGNHIFLRRCWKAVAAPERAPDLLAACVVALALSAGFALASRAQGQLWEILRADYGWQNERVDVTNRVRNLVRDAPNGNVRVNNQTMGFDPAVGKDKTLRIFARNDRGETRTFSYNEGGSIDARMFAGRYPEGRYPRYPPPPPSAAYPPPSGYPGQAGYNDLQIVRAYYGVNNRGIDVTRLLRTMVRDGSLSVQVNNQTMGGDPAVGADKALTVIYRLRGGREQSISVREGNTLRIP